MESRQFKHDRYLSKLEKHKESAEEASRYSSDRFDILLISLSTAALVLSMTFAKDFVKNNSTIDPMLLKISWIFFGACLILNLLSQVTGYYSNIYDIKVTTNLIRAARSYKVKGNPKKLENRCSAFNTLTKILNAASLTGLITGLTILIIFFTNNL